MMYLFRHGSLHRKDDGAVEFWKIKDNLLEHYLYCPHSSDDKRKKSMAGGGGNKKRYQYCTDFSGQFCTDSSGTIVYFRLFKDIQDAIWLIIHHRTMMCWTCVQSALYHHYCINIWRSKFEQQTNNFLFACDPDVIDLNVPRLAQYLYWVDINFALKKGFKFNQTRSAIFRQETLPASYIPKIVRMKIGEVIFEKVQRSPLSPPKIFLKHEWEREFDSEQAQRPEVGNYLEVSNQTNQFQIQVVRKGWDPFWKMTREPCKMEEKNIPFSGNRWLFISRRNCFSRKNGNKHRKCVW